jgi:formamidopyrimidine-DNA glycosylase
MPEGPEIAITVKLLNKKLANTQLQEFNILPASRYYIKAPNGYYGFLSAMQKDPITIERINCKGKFVWWVFSNGWQCWQSFSLTGGWYSNKKPKSAIELVYGQTDKQTLYYYDFTHYGTLKFYSPDDAHAALAEKLSTIGPDVLADQNFTFDVFRSIMLDELVQNRLICNVLIDQTLMSGIGNYLRAEILYAARVNPHCKVCSLSDSQLRQIYNNARTLIKLSYDAGGSISTYSDLNTMLPNFAPVFTMKVYGRKKDDLGNTVIAEKIGKDKDIQRMYWVPAVQENNNTTECS